MPKTTEVPEKLRPYHFHGVMINADPTQATGECPFCHADSKFGVKTATGEFRCLRCSESGNTYTFLARLHSESVSHTTEDDWEQLASQRGVSASSLRNFGFAKSTLTGEWLVPGYNAKGNLANLYRVVANGNADGKVGFTVLSTPTCKLQPFGFNRIVTDPRPTVWVCEGVWDACALWDALGSHRLAGTPVVKNQSPESNSQGQRLIKTNNPEACLLGRHAVIALPGSNSFNADWLEPLEGKDVRLVFDNDHPKRYPADHAKAGKLITDRNGKTVCPGWDGMQRVVKLASESKRRVKSLASIAWYAYQDFSTDVKAADIGNYHPQLKDGFDIRDLMAGGSTAGLLALQAICKPVQLSSPKKNAAPGSTDVSQPVVEPLPCTSFQELCDGYSSALHFTQDLKDTLAVMLTVVLSTGARTDHIWLRVIGPPGSGKSTLAEAVSAAREWVAPRSIMTGFHSGFVDMSEEGGKDKDNSPIARLNNKTVVMKDADTLINSPGRDRMLGEMRDFYDGTSRSEYRNNVSNNYEDLRITFILCGTDELRALNRTFLGERFLDIEIMRRGEDHSPYLRRATDNTYQVLSGLMGNSSAGRADEDELPESKSLTLKRLTYGYIKHLKESLSSLAPPEMSEEAHAHIQAMGQFVSYMRARIKHGGANDDLTYRPRAELATRLCSQFTKLAFFGAIVLGKHTLDAEVMRLVRKVVHDTALGFQFEITELLAREAEGLSTQTINLSLNVPETSLRRLLWDMREFEIIRQYAVPNNSGQRGRDRHLWQLTPMMKELWHRTFLEFGQPAEISTARKSPAANGKVSSPKKGKVARVNSKQKKK